jgi:hypothetical protein
MRKHFQSTNYFFMYVYVYKKFSYVILSPCHNLHISLLIEKRIVQTKNYPKVVTFVVMPWLFLKPQWLYIPPTIIHWILNFAHVMYLCFSYDSHSQRWLFPYSALTGHYNADTVYLL